MAEPAASETPHPRAVYDLEGHDEAEGRLAAAIASGRMHHAWMLSGPRGVGKATLAWRAARRLLGAAPDATGAPLGAEPDDPVCRRMETGAHGDLLVLERPLDARGGAKAEIPVEAARGVGRFFASTSGEGGWRVCLVDAADELTLQAANALLKTLEEPPPRCVFLLIAHAYGRVPVTVRSRCRRLRLAAPGVAAATRLVRRLVDADESDAQRAAELAHGRPGAAVRLALADGVRLQQRLQAVWDAPSAGDGLMVERLAEDLSARDGETRRSLAFGFARAHVQAHMRAAAEKRHGAPAWAHAWDGLQRLEEDLVRLRMDPKATMRQMFQVMATAQAADRT